jgi:hypothetical protein
MPTKRCEQCEHDYHVPPHRVASARFCGRQCMHQLLRRVSDAIV